MTPAERHGLGVAASIVRDLAELETTNLRGIRQIIDRAKSWCSTVPQDRRGEDGERNAYIVGFQGSNIGLTVVVHKNFVTHIDEAIDIAKATFRHTKLNGGDTKAVWVITPTGEAIDL